MDDGPIHTICVATADRPSALRRCLGSFGRNAREHGRTVRFVVADGSRSRQTQALTRQATVDVAREYGTEISYIGPEEVSGLHARLRGEGVGEEELAFAFTATPGFSAGGHRNVLLLLTAGERVVSVDDDIVCDVWTRPDRLNGIRVIGHTDDRHVEVFSSRASVLASLKTVAVDLLRAHEELLGQSIQDLIDAGRDVDTRRACDHVDRTRPHGLAGPTVRLTFAGVAGDSGVYCPHHILFGQGDAFDRLRASPTLYEAAISSREVTRIARQYTVAHAAHCMMYCAGLDNRGPLPPFSPVGRNEDGIFGLTLGLCDPHAMCGHAPFGVIHDSDRTAAYDANVIPSAVRTRLSDLLVALFRVYAARRVSELTPEQQLSRLGTYLQDVAAMPIREFSDVVMRSMMEERSRQLATAERATSGLSHLHAALSRYRETYVTHAKAEGFFVPYELRRESAAAGFVAAQEFLRRWGRLLQAWPHVWRAARRRHRSGDFGGTLEDSSRTAS